MAWHKVELSLNLPTQVQQAISSFEENFNVLKEPIEFSVDKLEKVINLLELFHTEVNNVFSLFLPIIDQFREVVKDLFGAGLSVGLFHNFNTPSKMELKPILPEELGLFYWDDDLKFSIELPKIVFPSLSPIKAIEAFTESFDNAGDKWRPLITETQGWGAVALVISAGTLPEFVRFIEAFNALVDFRAFNEFYQNLEKRKKAIATEFEEQFAQDVPPNPRVELAEKYLEIQKQNELKKASGEELVTVNLGVKNWVSVAVEDVFPVLAEVRKAILDVTDLMGSIAEETKSAFGELVGLVTAKIGKVTTLLQELDSVMDSLSLLQNIPIFDTFAATGVGLSSLREQIMAYETSRVVLGQSVDVSRLNYTAMVVGISYGGNESVLRFLQFLNPDLYEKIRGELRWG